MVMRLLYRCGTRIHDSSWLPLDTRSLAHGMRSVFSWRKRTVTADFGHERKLARWVLQNRTVATLRAANVVHLCGLHGP